MGARGGAPVGRIVFHTILPTPRTYPYSFPCKTSSTHSGTSTLAAPSRLS